MTIGEDANVTRLKQLFILTTSLILKRVDIFVMSTSSGSTSTVSHGVLCLIEGL